MHRGTAMTKQDKEYILTSMENLLDKKLQPIIDVNNQQTLNIQKHEQALFGVNGDNGLSGEMKTMKRFRNRVYATIGVAQGLSIGLGMWFQTFMGKK